MLLLLLLLLLYCPIPTSSTILHNYSSLVLCLELPLEEKGITWE
jgi:hypothetical protein